MIIETSTSFIRTFQFEISFGLCILFLAHIIMTASRKARNKLPPGPTGLPFVGYWPFLTHFKHLDFMKLAKKYGDVFSIKLGSQYAVIMHGGDAVIESLNNPAIFGRSPVIRSARLKPLSIFFGSNFDSWKEQRKIIFNSLRSFGFGKRETEKDMLEEINHFLNFIRKYKAQPLDVKKELFSCLINNLVTMIFGKRIEYGSPEHNVLYEQVVEEFDHTCPIPPEAAFPWLLYIPFAGKFLQTRKMRALNKACGFIFHKEISNHKTTFDSAHLRDFVDRYLFEIYTRGRENEKTTFSYTTLLGVIRELFAAGTETVLTSLQWFLYITAAFPEVQKKVQREIMTIIGTEKKPELVDMKNMPYTHAVLLEVFRWQTPAPLSLPRRALDDAKVEGYNIPKGTVVLHNLWAVHHDPRYWVEPEKFKPERFLSSDGKSIIRSKYLMPFSRGGRMCPGESMAILEIFLYCTSILREFSIEFPKEVEPTFKVKCTIAYRLEPHLLRFIPRN